MAERASQGIPTTFLMSHDKVTGDTVVAARRRYPQAANVQQSGWRQPIKDSQAAEASGPPGLPTSGAGRTKKDIGGVGKHSHLGSQPEREPAQRAFGWPWGRRVGT